MTIGVRTAVLAMAAVFLAASCGGGRTAVVGFGNGGNRIVEKGSILDEVAEVLAEYEGTPRVSDETIVQIFAAMVSRASRGEPEAALIVLRVAERQREPSDD